MAIAMRIIREDRGLAQIFAAVIFVCRFAVLILCYVPEDITGFVAEILGGRKRDQEYDRIWSGAGRTA